MKKKRKKKKLEHLDTPEVINVASNILPHGVIEHIDKSGRILSTPFLNKLVLKKGARIMLTYNVDTKDAGWPRCTVPYTMYGTGFFVYGTVRYKVGVYGILVCSVFFRL